MAKRVVVRGLFPAVLMLSLGAAPAMVGAEDGEKVFKAKNCIACHSLGDEKGKMAQLGGSLDGVGKKRDAAWLKAYLTDPKSQIPKAKMPAPKVSDQERDALVQYLESLK